MNKNIQNTFVLQQGQTDCGVACLASIIRFHGGDCSLERLRELSGTSAEGTTLLGLFESAKQFGFDPEGLEAESVDNLQELDSPAILHVIVEGHLQHYFVFYGFAPDGRVCIGDPGEGIKFLSKETLELLWQTKTLLKLDLNSNFQKTETTTQKKRAWFLNVVRQDFRILLMALLIGIVITALGLTTALFSQKLIDKIIPSGNVTTLLLNVILVCLLLLARSILNFIRSKLLIVQGSEFNKRIINRFYQNLIRLPKTFFDTRKIGEFISRMHDTSKVQNVISALTSNIIIDIMVVILSTGFIAFYSVKIGIILLTALPIYFLIAVALNNKIRSAQHSAMNAYAGAESQYVETIQGISTIKSTNRESFFHRLNTRAYDSFQEKLLALGEFNIKFGFASEAFSSVLLASILGFAAVMVIGKEIEVGKLVAIVSISGTIIPAIGRVVVANVQLQEARIAFDRMYEFAKIEPEYSSEDSPTKQVDQRSTVELTISNISFRFPGRETLIHDFSMSLNTGQIVSLLGESGSGKSTIIQILQKFYHHEDGTIEYNGRPIESVPTSIWRDQIGVVPQEIKIFNGNLLFNITLSDTTTDIESAIAFCQRYGFDGYFNKLPQGINSILGEGGINLSGGQKQLLGLARALWKMPSVLLLDESTSAMDRLTENFVISVLKAVKANIAILLITHRINTARHSDRIVILENGKTETSGTPSELIGNVILDNDYIRVEN